MAQYKLKDSFTKLAETSGVFYPVVGHGSVELTVGDATADTGFVVHEGCAASFTSSGGAIYARALGGHAVLNVVAGKLD